jgi:hypothetical protein
LYAHPIGRTAPVRTGLRVAADTPPVHALLSLKAGEALLAASATPLGVAIADDACPTITAPVRAELGVASRDAHPVATQVIWPARRALGPAGSAALIVSNADDARSPVAAPVRTELCVAGGLASACRAADLILAAGRARGASRPASLTVSVADEASAVGQTAAIRAVVGVAGRLASGLSTALALRAGCAGRTTPAAALVVALPDQATAIRQTATITVARTTLHVDAADTVVTAAEIRAAASAGFATRPALLIGPLVGQALAVGGTTPVGTRRRVAGGRLDLADASNA